MRKSRFTEEQIIGILREQEGGGKTAEERGECRLYECFVDGSFSKARRGADGIGCTMGEKV